MTKNPKGRTNRSTSKHEAQHKIQMEMLERAMDAYTIYKARMQAAYHHDDALDRKAINIARDRYIRETCISSDDIVIPHDAVVEPMGPEPEDGAFVLAWVWIPAGWKET